MTEENATYWEPPMGTQIFAAVKLAQKMAIDSGKPTVVNFNDTMVIVRSDTPLLRAVDEWRRKRP